MPTLAHIALEGELLPVAPENLDTANPEHFDALCALHGVFIHEIGHAAHTPDRLTPMPRKLAEAVALLEEIRMEARLVENRAGDAKWVRAAARHLILRETPDCTSKHQAAHLCVLSQGRVLAGTLRLEDVSDLAPMFEDVLGEEIYRKVLRICHEVTTVRDRECAERMPVLAQSMNELLGEDEATASALAAALCAAAEAAGEEASSSASEEIEAEGGFKEISEVLDEVKESCADDEAAAAPKKEAPKKAGHGHTRSGHKVKSNERAPTQEEIIQRNALAQMLRKARFRERTVVRRVSATPPGKLRMREALRGSAERAQGKMITARPWRNVHRRHNETPKLTVASLVDVSGSMSGFTSGIASSLWVIANAVCDVGGRTLGVAFGDNCKIVCDQRPVHVLDFAANGGRECIHDALNLADENLSLLKETGPRLVFIVSDGVWVDHSQSAAADASITDLRAHGVSVVQVGLTSDPLSHNPDRLCTIAVSSDLARIVGRAAVEALSENQR
jgi:hypothetical protein